MNVLSCSSLMDGMYFECRFKTVLVDLLLFKVSELLGREHSHSREQFIGQKLGCTCVR